MNTNHVSVGAVLAERYELTAAMASGGMAQVWRARDKILNRPVAIKVLHPHLATDDSFVARFRREAISSARLQHSSIVAVYDTVSEDGIEAIVMELIEGRTLRTILDHSPSLPPSTTVQIGMQIADALSIAHSHGVVHRDIKPANIMIDNEMRVVVTDFGIAKAMDPAREVDLTDTGTLLGTAKYLAPEQVSGDPIDPRTDLYALGVVLFEALVGEPPFNAETEAATALARLQGPVPRCRDRQASVPAALDAIIARAMATDPGDRFERAIVMRDALATADLMAPAVDDAVYGPPPAATADPTSPGGAPPAHQSRSSTDAPGALFPDSPAPLFPDAPPPSGPPSPGPNPAPAPAPVAAAASAAAAAAPDGTTVMSPDLLRQADVPQPPTRGGGKRAKRRWFGPTFVALLFVGALVVAGLLAMGGVLNIGGLGGVDTSGQPLDLVAATTLDPLGDNGEEREDRVGSAIDGDERTSWVTETYDNGLSQTKAGVGVAFAFDGRQQVGTMSIQSRTENWSGEIYILDEVPPASGWSDPSEVGDKIGEVNDKSGNFDIGLQSATGRGVMIWVTETGTTVDNSGATRNRLQIIEAVFR